MLAYHAKIAGMNGVLLAAGTNPWAVVAAAAVTGVATLAGIFAAQLYTTKRERRDELRELFDDCAAALSAALSAFDRRKVAPTEAQRDKTGEDFNEKVGVVQRRENQVAIRLGTSTEIYQSFRGACEAFEQLEALAWKAGANPIEDNRAAPARKQIVSARADFIRQAGNYISKGWGPRRVMPGR
jgi:hypothetical protein